MHRKISLTVIALALACAFAYAYSHHAEQDSEVLAQREVRAPLKKQFNSESLDTMSQTVTSQAPDSIDFKPPVLE